MDLNKKEKEKKVNVVTTDDRLHSVYIDNKQL